MYSNPTFTAEDWDQEALKTQVQDSREYAKEEAVQAQKLKEQSDSEQQQFDANTQAVNKDGSSKSSFDTKDPKQFGVAENAQEAVNAVVGGATDIVNSVAAIPQKLVDPRFYQTADGPYRPAWLPINPDDQPINRTVWGRFVRGAVELGGLMLLTRKAAGGLTKVTGTTNAVGKSLNYVAKGPTFVKGKPLQNLGKTIVHGAVSGAPGELVNSYATESNMAADLIKIRPDWEDALKPFATHERMSPATRSMYNLFESLGTGPALDIAMSGVSAGIKAVLDQVGKRGAGINIKPLVGSENDARFKKMRETAEKNLDLKVTAGAERDTEKAFLAAPDINKRWSDLTPEEKYSAKQAYARKAGYEWGDTTNPALKRQASQDKNETDVAVSRLTADPDGQKGFDPYINEGGDVHQGRANSTTRSFTNTLESIHRQSTNWADMDGTPTNFITKNELERINNAPGGVPITAEDYMKRMDRDPAFSQAVEDLRKARKSIDTLAPEVVKELDEFIAGKRTVYNMSDEEFKSLFGNGTNTYEGFDYYSDVDHLKAAVLTSTLNREMRDYAMAQKSVMDQLDPLAKDGTFDQILDRYTAIGIGLKQSRYLRSTALNNLKFLNGESGIKPPSKVEIQESLAKITTSQQTVKEMLREAVSSDSSDELLKLITDAFASSDKISTWKDLDTFFANKLHGYKDGDVNHKSAIQQELGALIIHSTISGPKTPVRAAFGTGLVTFTRPVQTAVGALLRGDARSKRGAFAQISGMYESLGESFKLFRTQLKSNFSGGEIPDLNTVATTYSRTQADNEWEALGQWVYTRGGDADQAAYGWANIIRGMNRNPLLTWSSKVMSASDMAFQNLMGRARLREMAYHKAYDSIVDAGGLVDDAAMPELVRKYEAAFYDEVFDENGLLKDQMAKYAASEAAMTLDVPRIVSRLEEAFDAHPFTKPFMLFTRTGYNALELAGKHTPIINRFITEVHQIKNLPTGHPDLIKYGITTVDEHEAAKALIRGREAMGASVVFGAAGLYMSGRLTGNGPEERTLRSAWEQTGWVPRSIKLNIPGVGEKWVSYDSLEPFNSFLSMVADIGDVSKEMGGKFTEKMLGRLWYLLQVNITNKSFLFGLSQLSELMGARSADQIGTIAAGMLNSYVPFSSMRNEIGKYFNPGMRELEAGFRDSLKNRNLWAGELADLPYKYDVLNGERLKVYDWATRTWNAVMPFQINLAASPTREMLWRTLYDVKVSVNTGPDNLAIPANLRSRWHKLIGDQNLESQLSELFKKPQIIQSIREMEADRNAGKDRDPMTYMHNVEIGRKFKAAKEKAWLVLSQDSEASALIQRKAVDNALAEMRKKGRYREEQYYEQQLLNLPYGK